MRAFIVIALFCSVAFAAAINQEECEPACAKDCMAAASKDPGNGNNCRMVLGVGPNGQGWYGSDEEGNDLAVTCEESCEATCHVLCNPREDEGNVQDRVWWWVPVVSAWAMNKYL